MKKQRKLNLRKISIATINNLTNIVGGQNAPTDPSYICITENDCDTVIGCDTIIGCDPTFTVAECEHTEIATCNVTKVIAFSNFGVCGAC